MERRNFLKLLFSLSVSTSLIKNCGSRRKPNILFFLVDDLGWKDLGCYGSQFYETPNIDKLALSGVKFMQSYTASAVCSPTRASILTGKHPARLHLTNWIGPDMWRPDGKMETPDFEQQLVHEEKTIAENLKDQGYSTGFIGKWHLGDKKFHPEYHGFDINIAGNSAGAPPSYFYPYENETWKGTSWPSKLEDLQDGQENEYLTDRLTDEALNYIDENKDDPFFLFLSHYAVHKPFQSKEKLAEKYKIKAGKMYPEDMDIFKKIEGGEYSRTVQNHDIYAGMIQSVDKSLGRIYKKLKEDNLLRDTIIIFSSDNGGLSTAGFTSEGGWLDPDQIVTSNSPLKTGKGWYYEGGIRVPTIIAWKGHVSQGKISNELIMSTDFYPTILDLAGLESKPEQHKDGVSLASHLRKGSKLKRQELHWHYPHYHNLGQDPASAIRVGNYKLIENLEDGSLELYNIKEDISEEDNLINEYPKIAKKLKSKLDSWRHKVNAQMPVKN